MDISRIGASRLNNTQRLAQESPTKNVSANGVSGNATSANNTNSAAQARQKDVYEAGPVGSAQQAPLRAASAPTPVGQAEAATGAAAPAAADPIYDPYYGVGYERAVEQLYKYFDLIDTANGKGSKDNKISMNDLKAICESPDLPKELRDACGFFYCGAGEQWFDTLSVASNKGQGGDRGSVDNVVTLNDVKAALADPMSMTESDEYREYKAKLGKTLQQLDTHFDLLDQANNGKTDGKIAKTDLQAVLDNQKYAGDEYKELREACRFLLNNSPAFNMVDVAKGKGKCDGRISREDVEMARASL